MIGWLGGAYLWVKAAHIIFVIFWMAGMFMLPRYFAYHSECEVGSDEDAKWIDREKRLIRIIINPAMAIAWILGLMLVVNIGLDAGLWLHIKLLLVFILSGFHGSLSKYRKEFARGERKRDSKFYRKINEIPAVFIIAIVLLAVPKAF
ncbi:CopD family protein [Kordiimonas lipolytica]|uniref:Protoporphyrinogen IX oxidase n=1 Tax=Kordiimonas lipolytica TaxID=1662421 RepID=A0ABV8U6C7_9PROT|nr:CopD family protein [Kordiimonas lipolytica]